MNPARKVRENNKIYFDGQRLYCDVLSNTDSSGRTIKFSYCDDLDRVLERIGEMPIPEYLGRKPDLHDRIAFQTDYANFDSMTTIAPPSAGLHFTNDLIKDIEKKGVSVARIRHSIGNGVYGRITVDDIAKHDMFLEEFEIPERAADQINKAIDRKSKVIAVGCSVVRALESSVLMTGFVKPGHG